jgi:hypothetical protein
VTVRENVALSGPAAASGGGIVERRILLAGERRRQDLNVKSGKAWEELERLGLSAPSTVARLDTGDWLRIRPPDRSFIAETWAEAASRLAKAGANPAEAPPFRNVVTSMDAPAQTRTIAGIECRKVTVDTTGDLLPAGDQPLQHLRLRAELCVAGNFPGRSELETFRKKEIDRLGLDPVVAQYRALAPARYAHAIDELARGLSEVDGVALESMLTITNLLSGVRADGGYGGSPAGDAATAGDSGEPAAIGTAGGLKRADAPTKFRQRTDLGQKYAAAGAATAPEWALRSTVTEIDVKPVDVTLFDPPAGYRRLVPKSRRQAAVAAPAASQ